MMQCHLSSQWTFSLQKKVDVCDYLQIQKHTRLYFCPKQFCVPFNLDNAWDSDSFRRLKWFIEHSSAQGNSAVKCDDRGKEKSKNRWGRWEYVGGREKRQEEVRGCRNIQEEKQLCFHRQRLFRRFERS